MPRKRDMPLRLGHAQFLKPDARQAHQRRRAWDERHAEACPYERHDREQLVRFLHDARCEARRRADTQHVIVEARGSRTRNDNERFGREGAQARTRAPPDVRPERGDQLLGQHVACLQPVIAVASTDEADVDLSADERVDL